MKIIKNTLISIAFLCVANYANATIDDNLKSDDSQSNLYTGGLGKFSENTIEYIENRLAGLHLRISSMRFGVLAIREFYFEAVDGKTLNSADVEAAYEKHGVKVYLHPDGKRGTVEGHFPSVVSFASNDYVRYLTLGDRISILESPYKEHFKDTPPHHFATSKDDARYQTLIRDYLGRGSTVRVTGLQKRFENPEEAQNAYSIIDDHTVVVQGRTRVWKDDEGGYAWVPWTILETMTPIEEVNPVRFCMRNLDRTFSGLEIVTKNSSDEKLYFYVLDKSGDHHPNYSSRTFDVNLPVVEDGNDELHGKRYCVTQRYFTAGQIGLPPPNRL